MKQAAISAPHHLAAQAGADILSEGGSAIEAMVAAAAAVSVVYPHMNALGGDGFWLIHHPGQEPYAIDACGRSGQDVSIDLFQNTQSIPTRGAGAAITTAGTVAGWKLALELDNTDLSKKLPLSRLLEPAKKLAKEGFEVSDSLQKAIDLLAKEAHRSDSYKSLYEPNGNTLKAGEQFVNSELADTFEQLSRAGLDDFYRGEIAEQCQTGLQAGGSPLSKADFDNYQAEKVTPLQVKLRESTQFNLPAPTQGAASLMTLAIADHLRDEAKTEADWVHLLVESTKRAFIWRNNTITDPSRLPDDFWKMTDPECIKKESETIDMQHAAQWPHEAIPGDTVWMGAVGSDGTLVSFIQSVYWEFGSAFVIPELGFVWNNRGNSFSLDPTHINAVAPNLKPFHTLNPAMAFMDDGRRLAYGCMGGEGQPQTQAALFSRYAWRNQSLSDAISDGRWLLGRTWGEESHNLKLEADLAAKIGQQLNSWGHDIAIVEARNEVMGHAGAVMQTNKGMAEAATDPRSDGAAIVVPVK